MTTTVRARFDGRVLVPEGPVDLPVNQMLELEVRHTPTEQTCKPALQELLETASKFPPDPDAPRDGAAQHDHYLYGTPKREDP